MGKYFGTDGYRSTVLSLKEQYKDKIEIFLGAELDYYSAGYMNSADYDYTIGSVHYARLGEKYIEYDTSAELAIKEIREDFCGDGMAYARAYYDNMASIAARLDFDIVGHFDVLTKYCEKYGGFLDTDSPVYRKMALEALHSVRERRELFEVNTGAISRGYRTAPYPAPFILDEMKRLDCKLVITSDCHNRAFLDCHFREAREYLRAHGFDTVYKLTRQGFLGEKI